MTGRMQGRKDAGQGGGGGGTKGAQNRWEALIPKRYFSLLTLVSIRLQCSLLGDTVFCNGSLVV